MTFTGTLVGSTSAAQTLTVSNNGGVSFTGLTVTGLPAAGFARSGGTCTATLTAGNSCTILVTFTPASTTTVTGSVTITGNAPVTGSPVSLTGTGAAATHTAGVSPSPLAFGNWATGTTSNPMNLTVTNTGNSALAGGTFTGIAAPFARVTTGTFPTGAGNCGATLAVGASCTIKVRFAPTAVTSSSNNLTVAYTGATVTPTSVVITGAGIAAKAPVSISPNPLTVNSNGSPGTVTLTNNAAAGGSSVAVTNVAVSGANLLWIFTKGTDNCTGVNLAPGGSCTVQVNLTAVLVIGSTTGSIAFTDTGATSPTGVIK